MSRRRDFLRIQRTGRKLHTRHFLVFVWPRAFAAAAHDAPPQLGVTVTRRVANAVGRNRIKRLVREAYRRERAVFPGGIQMVWVAKRDALAATFTGVIEQMREVGARLSAGRATGEQR